MVDCCCLVALLVACKFSSPSLRWVILTLGSLLFRRKRATNRQRMTYVGQQVPPTYQPHSPESQWSFKKSPDVTVSERFGSRR